MKKGQKLQFKRIMPPQTDSHKLSISLANKGRKVSKETKLKISIANKGRKYGSMSDEQKKKISDALKGRMPKFIPNNKGRIFSEEHKEKLSKIHIGTKRGSHSDETKKKISDKNWRGEKIGYRHLHVWVKKNRNKLGVCENCGESKKTDWANKSHKYLRVLEDWLELCRKCHISYDKNNRGASIKKYAK